MSELTEFILARLADDERDARDYGDDDSPGTWRRWGEDVCAALRAVVEIVQETLVLNTPPHATNSEAVWVADATLRALATIWQAHPDYRPEEWA